MNERYRPLEVLIETVASQEYLPQDAERYMPVRRVDRTKDKVSRAYWLQPFFENGQILFPAKHLQRNVDDWQALTDELILFPQAEHDDLFDALQTLTLRPDTPHSPRQSGRAVMRGSRYPCPETPVHRYRAVRRTNPHRGVP
jgi:hypothetical protein